MRTSLICGLLMAAMASGCRQAPSATSSSEPNGPSMPEGAMDWKQLRGTWKITESSRTGDARKRDLESTVRFDGERMTFLGKDGKPGDQCRYSLSPTQKPKHLDLVQLDAEGNARTKKRLPKGPDADAISPAVYDLNGDQLVLVICWTADPSKRPTALDAPTDDRTVRYRLERVK